MAEYGLACRDGEEELLDFANYVYNLDGVPTDFYPLLPKVYKKPGFANILLLAKENGRTKGLVNTGAADLAAGTDLLCYAFIGRSACTLCPRSGTYSAPDESAGGRCSDQGCPWISYLQIHSVTDSYALS